MNLVHSVWVCAIVQDNEAQSHAKTVMFLRISSFGCFKQIIVSHQSGILFPIDTPFPSTRRDDNPYRANRRVADSAKARAETELYDARKTVQDLALKIEEANSRAKRMHQKPMKQHEDTEDSRYAQMMKEIENLKQELGKLKLDMKHVLKEKRQADNTFKASSSKSSTLSSAVERIKKEIEELDEEQVLVEIARIEAVKELESIEAQRNKEASNYKSQLEIVKKKVKEIDQQSVTQDLQLTLYNVNSLENELARAKETNSTPDSLYTIIQELEAGKTELANIQREGFNFMTSMDVIRNELNHVREQRARLEKEEEKRDLTVQTLNSKILKGKAKLESITATTERANSIASNLSTTVEQLRAEAETVKKEKELIIQETENIKLEIPETESEIDLLEHRLEAAMEELKAVKSSEFTALENLKDLIDSTVRARESTSSNKPTITISKFEYEYLTGKADSVRRRRSVDGELYKLVASPRRSMYKIGSMTPGKRARSQKLLSPATRQAIKSASFSKKREKMTSNLAKLLDENDEMGE
ncbi:hypothetical protein CTI12_AA400770 [Artemisia annua]|uniref:WEB family n=1 Tax=Artemisia annua TaxID=35608 RepID=A0A2U1MAS1_ARTAN|nr:hypothetical protein CTI12_AA400770 [Artemisia annua]